MPELPSGIPKIIHQIWIGPNPKPMAWMTTFQEFCSQYGYEYRLWTEKEVEGLPWSTFPGIRQLYDRFGSAFAGKADILRILFLYKHGGIYIDADSVVTRPEKFADFLEKNEAPVFFGFEDFKEGGKPTDPEIRGDLINGSSLIAQGVIGAQPEHPFLRKACEEIQANYAKSGNKSAWISTGPVFITRLYTKYKSEIPDVYIYPMRLFYPIHWHHISDPELHKKIELPEDSFLFQYGYTTNNFAAIFKGRGVTGGGGRRKRTRRQTRRTRRGRRRSKRVYSA